MQATLTRRGALGGAAALALASCGGGDPPPDGRSAGRLGAGLLSSIVALEHAAIAAWAAIGEALRGDARRYARDPRARDRQRRARGGPGAQAGRHAAEDAPAEDYARLFPRLNDEADALHFARDLEERLVRAYLEGLRCCPTADQRASQPRSPPTRRRTWPWCIRRRAGRWRRSRSSRGRCEATRREACWRGGCGRSLRLRRAPPAPPSPPTPTSSRPPARPRAPPRRRLRGGARPRRDRARLGSCSATSASTSAASSRRCGARRRRRRRLRSGSTSPAGAPSAARRWSWRARRSIPIGTC